MKKVSGSWGMSRFFLALVLHLANCRHEEELLRLTSVLKRDEWQCLPSHREELGKSLLLTMVLLNAHNIATDNLWACKDCWLISLSLKESRESYSSSVRLFGKDTSSPIFSSAILRHKCGHKMASWRLSIESSYHTDLHKKERWLWEMASSLWISFHQGEALPGVSTELLFQTLL